MIHKNGIYYLIAIGLFILLKFWFASLENSDLLPLLQPTSALFGTMAGSAAVFSPEHGFYHAKFNILIDESCAGYNFMLMTFLMLYFLCIKYAQKPRSKLLLLPAGISAAYILTLFINASRILMAVLLQPAAESALQLNPAVAHETIGILTYFSFLLIIYTGVEKGLQKKYEKIT